MINGAKIKPHTITGTQIRAGSLPASVFAGELPTGRTGPVGPQGPAGLQGPPGPAAASILAAASATGGCSADIGTATTCASLSISLPQAGRLLLNATGEWHTFSLDDVVGTGSGTDDPTLVKGQCNLAVDGVQVGVTQLVGERQQAGVAANHPFGGTMALTGLSAVVAGGTHLVEVQCTEVDGDLDWGTINLTAAVVDDAS